MNPQLPRVLATFGFDRGYVRGEGCYLYDDQGRRYLDFLSGFGVFALGRAHPAITRALLEASDVAENSSATSTGVFAPTSSR